MNRRNKQRLDLQLVCRIGSGKVLSAPMSPPDVLVTENFSRAGILLRWLPSVPAPLVGSRLTVEVELPCMPGGVPRVMRCVTEVVRIECGPDANQLLGLAILKIRFVQASPVVGVADLAAMPLATPHPN